MQMLQTSRLIYHPADLYSQRLEEVVKAGDIAPVWARGMAYTYCNIGAKVELNISLRRIDGHKANFRAVLHRAIEPVNFNRISDRLPSEFYLPIRDIKQGEIECPVLVGIVEFIEKPEQGRLLGWNRLYG